MATVASLRAVPPPAAAPAPAPSRPKSGEQTAWRPDVAAMLAHDLKSPLGTVTMNLSYCLDQMGATLSGEVRAALEDCVAATAHAVRLVGETAEVSRMPRAAPAACPAGWSDSASLMARAVEALGPAAERVRWTAEPAPLRGDAALLERALERLLEWGIHQAGAGGHVEAEVRGCVVAVRVRPAGRRGLRPDAARSSLAVYFAEAALRSQGGALWTEEQDGALLLSIALPG